MAPADKEGVCVMLNTAICLKPWDFCYFPLLFSSELFFSVVNNLDSFLVVDYGF